MSFPRGGGIVPSPRDDAFHFHTTMTDTSARRPVVYLIAQPSVSRERPPLNVDPLYKHGEVVVLCPSSQSPTYKPRNAIRAIEGQLENYDPEVDFLVWAGGDTMAAVMVGMLLGERDIWAFQWLRYQRPRGADGKRTDVGAFYEPVRIDLTDPDVEVGYDVAKDLADEHV